MRHGARVTVNVKFNLSITIEFFEFGHYKNECNENGCHRAWALDPAQHSLLGTRPLGVVDFGFTKEAGLLFDLAAIAYDYDLHVGGVQILSRGSL